jgi:hypothetical protein
MNTYQTDFYAWTLQQAALLKAGKLAELDIAHLTEEIESMGNSEKRALESRLEKILIHLLKWQFQPERITPSWYYTIKEQRLRVKKLLRQNPSLKTELESIFIDSYDTAIACAETQTQKHGLFPAECPYTLNQLLDDAFFPGKSPDFLFD